MYTFPEGVRTRHEGSKSMSRSLTIPWTRPFIRLIVGFRGGTSGAPGPSIKQPESNKKRFLISKNFQAFTQNKVVISTQKTFQKSSRICSDSRWTHHYLAKKIHEKSHQIASY